MIGVISTVHMMFVSCSHECSCSLCQNGVHSRWQGKLAWGWHFPPGAYSPNGKAPLFPVVVAVPLPMKVQMYLGAVQNWQGVGDHDTEP